MHIATLMYQIIAKWMRNIKQGHGWEKMLSRIQMDCLQWQPASLLSFLFVGIAIEERFRIPGPLAATARVGFQSLQIEAVGQNL